MSGAEIASGEDVLLGLMPESESDDEAVTWLVPDEASASSWFDDAPAREVEAVPYGFEGTEAEIAPALAALIPAIISMAPALINAIGSLVGQGRPTPQAPPPAQPPRAAPSRPTPPPPPAPSSGRPTAPSPPSPPVAADVVAQLAALLPALLTLVGGSASQPQPGVEGGESVVAASPGCHEGSGGATEASETTTSETSSRVDVERTDEAVGAERLPGDEQPGDEAEAATDLVGMPDRSMINIGVSPCPTSMLVARFGPPREQLTAECQVATSPFWKSRMVTESIGPIRVTGHRNAVALFRDAFTALRTVDPDLYGRVGSMGMTCIRHVIGRPGVLSNHGLGLALDVTIDGRLDVRGHSLVQRGLVVLHDTFTRFGIYWGAGFHLEDAMHFEVGAEVVNRWIDEGSF